MSQKSVSNLIFDKFTELVKNDIVFEGVASELDAAVRAEKPKKADLAKIFQKISRTQDEVEEAAK